MSHGRFVSFVFLSWGRLVEESLVGRCFFFLFPPFNEFQNPKTAFWPQLPTNKLQRPRLIKKHFPNSFLVLSPELSPGRWQMVHHPLPQTKVIHQLLAGHTSFFFVLFVILLRSKLIMASTCGRKAVVFVFVPTPKYFRERERLFGVLLWG